VSALPTVNVALFALAKVGGCETNRAPVAEEVKKLPCAGKVATSEGAPAFKMPTLKTAEPLESAKGRREGHLSRHSEP
jgi:hypothetical protein